MMGQDMHLLVASILTTFLVFHCYPLLHGSPVISHSWTWSSWGHYRAQAKKEYAGILSVYLARYIFNGIHVLVDCVALSSVILNSDATKAVGGWRKKATPGACKMLLDPVYSLPIFAAGNVVLMAFTYGTKVLEMYHLLISWHDSVDDLKSLEAWTGEKFKQTEGRPKPVSLFIALNILSASFAAIKGALIVVVYRYYLSTKAERRKLQAEHPAVSRDVELQSLPSGTNNTRRQSSADMGRASSSRTSDANLPAAQRKISEDSYEEVEVLFAADMSREQSELTLARSFSDVDVLCGSSIALLPVESEEKLAVAAVRAQVSRSRPTSAQEVGEASGTARGTAVGALKRHSPRGHVGTPNAQRVSSHSKHDDGTRAARATRVDPEEPSTSTGFLVAAGASKSSHTKSYGLRKSTKRVKNVSKGAVRTTSVFLGKMSHKVGRFISKHGGRKKGK